MTAGGSRQLTRGRYPLRAAVGFGSWAPALLLAVSAAASLAYAFTFLRPTTGWLDGYLPMDPAAEDPILAVLWAIGLGALALGLVRGRSVAWWLAIAILAVSLIGQARALSRPVGVLVIGGLLAVLLADRRRYEVETAASWRRRILALLAVGGLAIGLETSLILAATGTWPTPLGAVGDITSALGNALGMSDATADRVLHRTSRDALVGLLILASRLPIVLAALGVLSRVPEPPVDPTTRARGRAIAEKYGCGALLPFQLGEDKHVFSPPDADGIVVYGLAGRTAVVLGDPIGSPEASTKVFSEFLARCRKLGRLPVVYQASAASRALLVGAGFRMFKVGEEAIVDLSTFDLTGPRRANLRHTITRCRKDGVTFRWFAHGMPAEEKALLADLEAIDATWRKGAGPQMGFTISHFDRTALAWQPISLAVDPSGRALGYTTFRRTGVDGGWVLDLMRRAPDGPPGVVEACIAEAAVAFRAAGASTLSLGMAPLAGLDRVTGTFEERLLANAGRLVGRWYDVRGLFVFKRKFDPYWIPRYGAMRRRHDLIGFTIGLMRVHLSGALRLPGRRRTAPLAAAA
ncbi:MAG: phosphatidylglycerol lysyltransferase domain-containing protein [Candidatus Limnocylindrales bacterium]